jgi:hypothetical protein
LAKTRRVWLTVSGSMEAACEVRLSSDILIFFQPLHPEKVIE